MSKNVKMVLISLSGLCLILLYTTLSFYNLKENESGKRSALQKTLDETNLAKGHLEDELKERERENAELENNVKSYEEKVTILSQRLEEEKIANNRSLAKVQEKESEIDRLKSELEEEGLEKEELLKRLERLNEDYLNIKAQLEAMLKAIEDKEKKVKEPSKEEGISLGTIVIKQTVE